MEHYGIRGTALSLISSYLNNRTQSVHLPSASGNPYKSDSLIIRHGVPQGSILGPLLFLTYINDLPKFISPIKSILYADDTTLLVTSKDSNQIDHISKQQVTNLNTWFSANNLILNVSKTNKIEFSAKTLLDHSPISAHAETLPIPSVNSVKFLGLRVDANLNWKAHVGDLIPKLNSACYALKQMCQISDLNTLLLIYNSYFQSHLTYGIIFWGNSVESHLIFKIQKRALRIINHSSKFSSCRPLFLKFKILPLFSLYIYEILRFCKKNQDKFTMNNYFHNYFTRHGTELSVPKHRLTLLENGPFFSCIKYFNLLPAELRMERSYSSFSKKLKNILVNNVVYDESDLLDTFKCLT